MPTEPCLSGGMWLRVCNYLLLAGHVSKSKFKDLDKQGDKVTTMKHEHDDCMRKAYSCM